MKKRLIDAVTADIWDLLHDAVPKKYHSSICWVPNSFSFDAMPAWSDYEETWVDEDADYESYRDNNGLDIEGNNDVLDIIFR